MANVTDVTHITNISTPPSGSTEATPSTAALMARISQLEMQNAQLTTELKAHRRGTAISNLVTTRAEHELHLSRRTNAILAVENTQLATENASLRSRASHEAQLAADLEQAQRDLASKREEVEQVCGMYTSLHKESVAARKEARERGEDCARLYESCETLHGFFLERKEGLERMETRVKGLEEEVERLKGESMDKAEREVEWRAERLRRKALMCVARRVRCTEVS